MGRRRSRVRGVVLNGPDNSRAPTAFYEPMPATPLRRENIEEITQMP